MNEYQKKTISKMLWIYCKTKHNSTQSLCNDCKRLENYAYQRLESCPFGEKKPACKNCTTHCYKKDMRKKMQEIMRFSGPRMFFFYPLDAIRHLFNL